MESPAPSIDKSNKNSKGNKKNKDKDQQSFEMAAQKYFDIQTKLEHLEISDDINIDKWVILKNDYDELLLPAWEVYSKQLDDSYEPSGSIIAFD